MGALLLLVVGVYAARGPLFERLVLRRVQTVISQHLGGRVEVASLAGDWLTGFELRGITLHGGAVVREIVGGQAELDLGLWTLWQSGLHDLNRIEVRADRVLVVLPAGAMAANAWADEARREAVLAVIRGGVEGAVLGGAVVSVDDFLVHGRNGAELRGPLRLQVPARGVGAALQGTLDAPSLQVAMRAQPDGALHLQASSAAAGHTLRLLGDVPEELTGAVELQVDVAAEASTLAFTGTARDVSFVGHKVSEITLQAAVQGRELRIASLVAREGESQVSLRDYRAEVLDPHAGVGSVTVAARSLRPLLEYLPLGVTELAAWRHVAAELDGLEGTLEFTLRDAALHARPATLKASYATIQVTDGLLPLRAAQLPLARAAVVVELRAADVPEAGLPAWLGGLPLRPVAGQVRVACMHREQAFHVQLDPDLTLRDPDGLAGTLSGSLGMPLGASWELHADCVLGGALLRGLPPITATGRVLFATLDGDLRAQLDPLLLRMPDVGSIEMRGSVPAFSGWRQAWSESAVTMQLRNLAASPFVDLLVAGSELAGSNELRGATVNGQLMTGGASRAQLQINWPELPVIGGVVAKIEADVSGDGLALRDCRLESSVGSMQLDAEMPGATLAAVLADPMALLAAPITATAQIRSAALPTLAGPERAEHFEGSLALAVELRGSLSEPVVAVQVRENDAAFKALTGRWARLGGGLRLEDDALHILGVGFSVGETIVRFDGKLAHEGDIWRGQLDGVLTQLPLDVPDTKLHAAFVVDSGQLRFERFGVGNDLLTVAADDLAIVGGLDAWSNIRSAQGLLDALAAPLRGRLQINVPDLSRLPGLANRQELVGNLAAELSLAGTLRAPLPTVTAQVDGVSFRLPEGPRIEDLRARIVALPTRIDCKELSGTISGGVVRASGTFVSPRAWWLAWQEGECNIQMGGKDVLLRRRNGIKVRSDLDLTATGPLSNIQLKGSLATQASKVVQRLPYFTLGHVGGAGPARGLALVGPDLGEHVNVHLDLAVTSARPIQIVTNVLAGEVTSAIAIRGTLSAPRIEGTLAMPRGTITFPGCTFRTSNALLQFDRDDSSFPTVSLNAAGRRHGYDVRMVVRGSYHEPEIQLSSTPPLPPEQLAVLVTTGARPDSLQGTRAVGALLGSYLVQELADHLFGSESTEAKEGFVSRFEVETGTEISANGTESIVVNFRVFDNVFLQGERDVYEDVNLGLVYRIRFQ